MKEKPEQRYRILSLDGGGVRGVLTATLLKRMEEARPGLLEKVDLFAGTSTGSLQAVSLADGMPPAQLQEYYELLSPEIFSSNWFKAIPYLGNALNARYNNSALRKALAEKFGSKRLGDLKKKVLIASFEIDSLTANSERPRSWKPKFFNNFPGQDPGERIIDVLLSSSAAPTYLPGYQRFIDGGVTSNNPSMCALAQALDAQTGRQKLKRVVVLSLGTGYASNYLPQRDITWGWLRWTEPLVSIMLEGNGDVAAYQVERLLGERSHRLNPILGTPVALDDVKAISQLKRFGEELDIQPTLDWLDKVFLA